MTIDEELAQMYKVVILLLMQKYAPTAESVELSLDHANQLFIRFDRPDLFVDRVGESLILKTVNESDVAAMCEARDARQH